MALICVGQNFNLLKKTCADVAHAQWLCCGVRGPRDFAYSAWYNRTRDIDDSAFLDAVPASCCPPADVAALLRHRCQQNAARLQLDSADFADSAHNTAQNPHYNTTHRQTILNRAFRLQVTLEVNSKEEYDDNNVNFSSDVNPCPQGLFKDQI